MLNRTRLIVCPNPRFVIHPYERTDDWSYNKVHLYDVRVVIQGFSEEKCKDIM